MPKTAAQTVLVIDDTPDLLNVIRQHLAIWGYRPLIASTEKDGLTLAEAEQPDLILLDMLMPKMNGREVCSLLKANPKTAGIPVIFLSALEMPEHIRAGMHVGAEDYITKPFEPDELKRHIKVCLLRHNGTPPPKPSRNRTPS